MTFISPVYPSSTVPGVLRTVKPFLMAKPLLGLTCTSLLCGISMYKPVGIRALPNGSNVTFSLARKSNPESLP